MTSLGLSSTADVITFDQNWQILCINIKIFLKQLTKNFKKFFKKSFKTIKIFLQIVY